MLIEKIKADRKAAMLARNTVVSTLLGTLISAVQNKEKTFNPERALTNDEVVAQIKKLIDGATETVGHLKAHNGSVEAIAKAQAEIDTLNVYMPQQLDETAIETFLRQKVSDGAEQSIKTLMNLLRETHGGAYDGKLAAAVVKRVIA